MIDRETVQNVARLARLGLSEEEIETFKNQLSTILEHIQILEEADVSRNLPHSTCLTPNQRYPCGYLTAFLSTRNFAGQCPRPRR